MENKINILVGNRFSPMSERFLINKNLKEMFKGSNNTEKAINRYFRLRQTSCYSFLVFRYKKLLEKFLY